MLYWGDKTLSQILSYFTSSYHSPWHHRFSAFNSLHLNEIIFYIHSFIYNISQIFIYLLIYIHSLQDIRYLGVSGESKTLHCYPWSFAILWEKQTFNKPAKSNTETHKHTHTLVHSYKWWYMPWRKYDNALKKKVRSMKWSSSSIFVLSLDRWVTLSQAKNECTWGGECRIVGIKIGKNEEWDLSKQKGESRTRFWGIFRICIFKDLGKIQFDIQEDSGMRQGCRMKKRLNFVRPIDHIKSLDVVLSNYNWRF